MIENFNIVHFAPEVLFMFSLSLLGSIKDHFLPDLYSHQCCGHGKSNTHKHLEVGLLEKLLGISLCFYFICFVYY